jgi:Cyclic nucleotide-binding domain
VIVPGIVVAPSDLVAANLITGNADSLSVLAGPLLASGLLVVGGPGAVFGACAGISVVCVLMTWPLDQRRLEDEFSVPRPESNARAGDLVGVVRTMSETRGARELLLVLGAQYSLIGALDLLYINLAFRVLDLDAAGAGFLNAAFGAGAVLGGLLSVFVITRRRLAGPMVGALFVIAIAMAGLGARTTLIVTLLALPIAGICRSLVDVSGRMLLQRLAAQDVLASVFAVVEIASGVGILCGTLLVQLLIAVSGVSAAVTGVGVLFLGVGAVTAPGLRHADQHADTPVVEIRLLRTVPLFAPLPGSALDLLARTCRHVDFAAGDTIMREGDVGDSYYVIADGLVEVSAGGVMIRTMRRGEGFGEIALLAGLPRTATVTALAPTSTLSIERSNFLAAVIGHDASAVVAWAIARRLHPPLAGDGF